MVSEANSRAYEALLGEPKYLFLEIEEDPEISKTFTKKVIEPVMAAIKEKCPGNRRKWLDITANFFFHSTMIEYDKFHDKEHSFLRTVALFCNAKVTNWRPIFHYSADIGRMDFVIKIYEESDHE